MKTWTIRLLYKGGGYVGTSSLEQVLDCWNGTEAWNNYGICGHHLAVF